ncbi:MAG: hypothetical protein AB7V32_00675 [Candidatus Berkiella sp.]
MNVGPKSACQKLTELLQGPAPKPGEFEQATYHLLLTKFACHEGLVESPDSRSNRLRFITEEEYDRMKPK